VLLLVFLLVLADLAEPWPESCLGPLIVVCSHEGQTLTLLMPLLMQERHFYSCVVFKLMYISPSVVCQMMPA
jgi:hypothetical protein